jgi:hypothetical protein
MALSVMAPILHTDTSIMTFHKCVYLIGHPRQSEDVDVDVVVATDCENVTKAAWDLHQILMCCNHLENNHKGTRGEMVKQL